MASPLSIALLLILGTAGASPSPKAPSPSRDSTGPSPSTNAPSPSGGPSMQDVENELVNVLTPQQLQELLGSMEPTGPAPKHQEKIDHFVILFMENRAFDHLFGCHDKPGIDGVAGGHQVPIDPNNASKGFVNVTCGSAKLVCDPGPSMQMWGQHFNSTSPTCTDKYPYCGPDAQNDKFSVSGGGLKQGSTVEMFAPSQLPVKTQLVEDFGLFNRYFTSTPTASTPNHLFAQSATSCGQTGNSLYSTCGGTQETYPQPTIYDNMRLNNVSFALYMNNTGAADWPGAYLTPVDMPDVILQGVARYRSEFRNHTDFYTRAADGTLPAVSWIHPPGPMMDHPCHDMALGERLHKDIYEALRSGPKWNKTLLAIVYDDGGDFYDHVVPPFEGVPADGAGCHVGGKCDEHFDFRRLGPRGSALLISPWVAKGAVYQEPAGPTNTSQFEHSSLSATITNLFNLSRDKTWALGPVPGFLTQRDAWAGSFHELLTEEIPREDCPLHLPTPPVPATPFPGGLCDNLLHADCGDKATKANPKKCAACIAEYRPNLLRAGCQPQTLDKYCTPSWTWTPGGAAEERRRLSAAGAAVPQHCGGQGEARQCFGDGATVDSKQRNRMQLLSRLTRTPEPDIEGMDWNGANAWLHARWREWMGVLGGPIH